MSTFSDEEYVDMLETAEEYDDVLEVLHRTEDENEVVLEYEEDIDEAIKRLMDAGLVEERGRSNGDGVTFSYHITAIGREMFGYTENTG